MPNLAKRLRLEAIHAPIEFQFLDADNHREYERYFWLVRWFADKLGNEGCSVQLEQLKKSVPKSARSAFIQQNQAWHQYKSKVAELAKSWHLPVEFVLDVRNDLAEKGKDRAVTYVPWQTFLEPSIRKELSELARQLKKEFFGAAYQVKHATTGRSPLFLFQYVEAKSSEFETIARKYRIKAEKLLGTTSRGRKRKVTTPSKELSLDYYFEAYILKVRARDRKNVPGKSSIERTASLESKSEVKNEIERLTETIWFMTHRKHKAGMTKLQNDKL